MLKEHREGLMRGNEGFCTAFGRRGWAWALCLCRVQLPGPSLLQQPGKAGADVTPLLR